MIDINWNEIRKDVIYVAMDRIGDWFGYTNKPTVNDIYEVWQSGAGGRGFHLKIDQIDPCNWESSLLERPSDEQKYFEVLDRCWTLNLMFDNLLNSDSAKALPSYEKVQQALADLYQEAGSAAF